LSRTDSALLEESFSFVASVCVLCCSVSLLLAMDNGFGIGLGLGFGFKLEFEFELEPGSAIGFVSVVFVFVFVFVLVFVGGDSRLCVGKRICAKTSPTVKIAAPEITLLRRVTAAAAAATASDPGLRAAAAQGILREFLASERGRFCGCGSGCCGCDGIRSRCCCCCSVPCW